jgi:hypothetical protein
MEAGEGSLNSAPADGATSENVIADTETSVTSESVRVEEPGRSHLKESVAGDLKFTTDDTIYEGVVADIEETVVSESIGTNEITHSHLKED